MKNMTKTAGILDKLLHILHVVLTVGMVILLVCLCLIGAYFLFDLDPGMVGNGFDQVDFGILTITVAEAHIPDYDQLFLVAAGEMLLILIVCFFCQRLINCFLAILAPMKEGAPFLGIVSQSLKKASKVIIVLGILFNLAQLYGDMAKPILYGLPGLLLSDKITHITIHSQFDLSFLLFAAVLLLLSCVFRYGEELQQLSDETL